jgi:hypothetical protein
MSLINDALKKAQKLQTQGQAPSPPNPDGTPGAPGISGTPGRPAGPGRDRSVPGQVFMLLAFGAGALIALSVLATVYLLRQPAALSPTGAATPVVPEKPAPALSLPAVSVSNPSNGPAPAQNPAPALEKFPTTTNTTPAVAATPTASFFNPLPPPPAPSQPVASPPALSLPALSLSNGSNPSNGLDPSKPDPKVLAYLDALQIAGVRVSDTGSKVLMNDRVYRENEIVDHLLGLRLKKVDSDTLTFEDERGVIYTKNL